MVAAAADREDLLKRGRARSALAAIGWTVGSAQVMFWSFAIGAALGPGPLLIMELIAGALFAFALGMVMSSVVVRRRLEADAVVIARVREGKRGKRLAVFDEFLTIDEELILRSRVKKALLTDGPALELAIASSELGDEAVIVTRSFGGPRPVLARVRDDLSITPAPAAQGAPAREPATTG